MDRYYKGIKHCAESKESCKWYSIKRQGCSNKCTGRHKNTPNAHQCCIHCAQGVIYNCNYKCSHAKEQLSQGTQTIPVKEPVSNSREHIEEIQQLLGRPIDLTSNSNFVNGIRNFIMQPNYIGSQAHLESQLTSILVHVPEPIRTSMLQEFLERYPHMKEYAEYMKEDLNK